MPDVELVDSYMHVDAQLVVNVHDKTYRVEIVMMV